MIPYKPIKKKLTHKEKEQLIDDIASNVFEKMLAMHKHAAQFVPRMSRLAFKNRKHAEDMIKVELALVKEQLPKNANEYDYNVPDYTHSIIYDLQDLMEKDVALKNELFPNTGARKFQDVLDEIGVNYYSMSGGQSRTITKNHYSPIIASVIIKELNYAIGIVKTPRTVQPFEVIRQEYGTKLHILNTRDAIGKIERLNGKTIIATIDEAEYAKMRQEMVIEEL